MRRTLQGLTCLVLVLAPAHARSIPEQSYGDDAVVIPTRDTFEPQLIVSPLRMTVFLNFDGAELKSGGNDSRTNRTDLITVDTLAYPALEWTRFGGREQGLKAVLDELKLLFGDYAIEFVTSRPPSGDYTMIMIGGSGENIRRGAAGTLGIAPLDCSNTRINDLAVVLGEKITGGSKQLAYVIAHELGHTLGLEHVTTRKEIMFPALNSETCCFGDSEVQAPSSCGRKQQSTKKLLLENVGPGEGDTVLPRVWFVRPAQGAVLPPNFSVEVGAVDDLRLHHVTLQLDGQPLAELGPAPYVVTLTKLADGEHTLSAEAVDYKPNTTRVEVKVRVDARCITEGTCHFGSGAPGAPCKAGSECTSGLCALADGKGSCVTPCAGEGGTCASGQSCQQQEGVWACLATGGSFKLSTGGAGCGCAASGDRPVAGMLALLLLVAVLAMRRRR